MGRGQRSTISLTRSPAQTSPQKLRTLRNVGPDWADRRIATFDVESTGVDIETDRIVTASVIFVGGGKPTVSHSWIINPGVSIPEEATEVHGITNEKARAEGQAPAVAIEQIKSMLQEATDEGMALVAYNARFDISILDREARRHGVEPLDKQALECVVDPFVLDKQLDPYRKGSRKLTSVCAHYGIEFDEDTAHDADVDSLNAARLAYRISKRYAEEINVSLPELSEKQTEWARAQAISLQEHFDREGRDAKIQPEWPLVPSKEAPVQETFKF